MQAPLAPHDDVQDAKEQAETILEFPTKLVLYSIVLEGLFRVCFVETLARYSYRAADFSWQTRKIDFIKLLPSKDERL